MADNRYVAQKDIRRNQEADQLAEFLGAISKQRQAATIEANQRQADIEAAQGLANQYPDRNVHTGTAGISGKDPLTALLRAQQLGDLQDDRLNRAVERGSKSLIESNLPAATEAFKRIEGVTPGIASGKAQPKSVGGIKTLLPNFAVPIAEKLGLMQKGSAEERAALQDLANTKIYDTSGKQINEAEMRRINDSMGLRGVFQPEVVQQGIQEMGNSILRKGQTAEAGIRPQAKAILQSRGAVSTNPLAQYLKGPSKADQIMQRIQELEAKRSKAGVK